MITAGACLDADQLPGSDGAARLLHVTIARSWRLSGVVDSVTRHGWQAEAAALPDLPQTPTVAVQELPTRDLQTLLPQARVGWSARCPGRRACW